MRHRIPRLVIPLVVLLSAGLAACASGGAGGSTRGGNGDVLLAEEMAQWASQDLYEVVRRLRPRWLQSRAPQTVQGRQQITIFVDGVRQDGGPDVLRAYRTNDIDQVSYLNASDATTRYGTDMTAGALLVVTKH